MAAPLGSGLLNILSQGKTLLGPKQVGTASGPNPFPQITYGWWVFIGCLGAVLLANTPVAPMVLGIMTIASLYQLEHLVSHT